MKLYVGTRLYPRSSNILNSVKVVVQDTETGRETLLRYYFPYELAHQMPFDWGAFQIGYAGTNLSASILADHFSNYSYGTPEAIPVKMILAFLREFIVKLPDDYWEIEEAEVEEFVLEYAEAEMESLESFEARMEVNMVEDIPNYRLLYPQENSYILDWDEYRGADR